MAKSKKMKWIELSAKLESKIFNDAGNVSVKIVDKYDFSAGDQLVEVIVVEVPGMGVKTLSAGNDYGGSTGWLVTNGHPGRRAIKKDWAEAQIEE